MDTHLLEQAWEERDTHSASAANVARGHLDTPAGAVLLAYLTWRQGDVREAERLNHSALPSLRAQPPGVWYARALNVAACVAYGMNHIDQALHALEEQLRVSEVLGHDRLEAIARHDIAAIIREIHPAGAQQMLLQVIETFKRDPEPLGLPLAHFNLGNIYQDAGADESAAACYLSALQAPQAVLKPAIESLILTSVLPLLDRLGRHEDLALYRGRLKALHDTSPDLNVQAQAWVALARHADPGTVAAHLTALIPQLEARNNHEYLHLLYQHLSEAHTSLNACDLALDALQRSLHYQQQIVQAQRRHTRRLLDGVLSWKEAERQHLHLRQYTQQLEREHAELTRLSRTDPLTGLANRHHLRQAVQSWTAGGGLLSVALLDIDRFKQVNDRWGHGTGDQVIQAIAQVLQRVAGPDDLAVRYGGEEFLLVRFGGGSIVTECHVAMEAVRHLVFQTGPDTFTVTVSVGVALDGQDFVTLVEQADQQLYTVKRDGRDGLRV